MPITDGAARSAGSATAGAARLLVRRETAADMRQRDVGL
jgi:hypothetical protein